VKAFSPEQIAALTKAGFFDAGVPRPALVEGADVLVRRAHISSAEMERVANELSRDGRRHLATDLRVEADKLRKATDAARRALG